MNTRSLETRVERIERSAETALPWHLPADLWSDAQLLAVAAPGRAHATDAELQAIMEGRAHEHP